MLVIFGTGDIAKIALHYFTHDSEHEVAAFTVDRAFRHSEDFQGLPLVDFEEVATRYPPSHYSMFVALSYARMNKLRAAKYVAAKERGYRLASYISSRSTYLSASAPGDNCFILEGTIVQPFVRIGNDVTLWSGTHIGHDSLVGDHCFLAPEVAVSGGVIIRPYCFIGINATLRNAITIASETLIGAGAVITQDTVPGGVYLPHRATLDSRESHEIEI